MRSENQKNYSDDVLIALRKIIRAVDLHSRRLVQKHGVTGPQLVVLREISGTEDLSISRLAERVSLSHATVTNVLERLEKRGYVIRKRSDTDRRRVIVEITPAGAVLMESKPSLLQEKFINEFERLEDWEKTQILSSLQRVVSMMAMEEETKDSSPILVSGPMAVQHEGLAGFEGH